MSFRFLGAALGAAVGVVLVACGGGGDPGPGFGGEGGVGEVSVVTGSVSTAATGGVTGPPQCAEPQVFHAIVLENGATLRSDGDGPNGPLGDSSLQLTGVVVEQGPLALRIDACGVAACMDPEVYEIVVPAGVTGLDIPLGAFVSLTYDTRPAAVDMGASYALTITNLPTLDGAMNPVDASDAVWFAGMHGLVKEAAFVPSMTLSMTCYFWEGDGSVNGHDLFVHAASEPEHEVQIAMGQSAPYVVTTAPSAGAYVMTNLQSTLASGVTPLASVDFYVERAPM